MGGKRVFVTGTKKGRRWMPITHLPSAILQNHKDFLTLQKAMDKTLSTAFMHG